MRFINLMLLLGTIVIQGMTDYPDYQENPNSLGLSVLAEQNRNLRRMLTEQTDKKEEEIKLYKDEIAILKTRISNLTTKRREIVEANIASMIKKQKEYDNIIEVLNKEMAAFKEKIETLQKQNDNLAKEKEQQLEESQRNLAEALQKQSEESQAKIASMAAANQSLWLENASLRRKNRKLRKTSKPKKPNNSKSTANQFIEVACQKFSEFQEEFQAFKAQIALSLSQPSRASNSKDKQILELREEIKKLQDKIEALSLSNAQNASLNQNKIADMLDQRFAQLTKDFNTTIETQIKGQIAKIRLSINQTLREILKNNTEFLILTIDSSNKELKKFREQIQASINQNHGAIQFLSSQLSNIFGQLLNIFGQLLERLAKIEEISNKIDGINQIINQIKATNRKN